MKAEDGSGPEVLESANWAFVKQFNQGGSGPWNPLVHSEREVAEAQVASESGLAAISTLLLVATLVLLFAGTGLIRR